MHQYKYLRLEMAEDVLPKLDIVLKKLEAMETKLDNLGSYVKNVDAKVNALTTKVETLEATTRNAMRFRLDKHHFSFCFLHVQVLNWKTSSDKIYARMLDILLTI